MDNEHKKALPENKDLICSNWEWQWNYQKDLLACEHPDHQ